MYTARDGVLYVATRDGSGKRRHVQDMDRCCGYLGPPIDRAEEQGSFWCLTCSEGSARSSSREQSLIVP